MSPGGIKNLDFGQPAPAINRAVKKIRSKPDTQQPDAIVVNAHAGADADGDDTTLGKQLKHDSEFTDIVKKTSPKVDAIFTGHTHKQYAWQAKIPGTDRKRPVIQTGSYGDNLGKVVLKAKGDGTWKIETVKNLDTSKSSHSGSKVEKVGHIVDAAKKHAKKTGGKKAGRITDSIRRARGKRKYRHHGHEDRGKESALGDLVADSYVSGIAHSPIDDADFGVINPGGLRDDLRYDKSGDITIAELNAVTPFANQLGVVSLTGKQIKKIFEEQWQPSDAARPFLNLGISKQVHVVRDSKAPSGHHIKRIDVRGNQINPDKKYRVATNNFLAEGGDNFGTFADGKWQDSGEIDFSALRTYFKKHSPVSPAKHKRQVAPHQIGATATPSSSAKSESTRSSLVRAKIIVPAGIGVALLAVGVVTVVVRRRR